MEVDARPGRQSFAFDVVNSSRVDQRILGFPADGGPWGDQPSAYTIRVGTENERFPLTDTRFTGAPVTVPAGQDRDMQIAWNHLEASISQVAP